MVNWWIDTCAAMLLVPLTTLIDCLYVWLMIVWLMFDLLAPVRRCWKYQPLCMFNSWLLDWFIDLMMIDLLAPVRRCWQECRESRECLALTASAHLDICLNCHHRCHHICQHHHRRCHFHSHHHNRCYDHQPHHSHYHSHHHICRRHHRHHH